MKLLTLLVSTTCIILAVSSIFDQPRASLVLDNRSGFTDCLGIFPGNQVPHAASDTVLDICRFAQKRAIYAVRFDTGRKTPNWTVHKLSPQNLKKLSSRKRPRFYPDKKIEATFQALDKNYTKSGFSRGHIVPAHDMSWNAHAYKATFTLTNVVPQKQQFNAGPWLGMESTFRKLVKQKNQVLWEYSGVYGQVANTPTIGMAPHTPVVPKCYYKIIVAQGQNGKPFKVLAALFKWNDFGKRKTWRASITTLNQITKRTGINFLHKLAVENTHDTAFWGVPMPQNIGDCQ